MQHLPAGPAPCVGGSLRCPPPGPLEKFRPHLLLCCRHPCHQCPSHCPVGDMDIVTSFLRDACVAPAVGTRVGTRGTGSGTWEAPVLPTRRARCGPPEGRAVSCPFARFLPQSPVHRGAASVSMGVARPRRVATGTGPKYRESREWACHG